MTETTEIRTRFAPSPSGHLHVGGARTALFCWAYARKHGGRFILRIEDTDQKRSSDFALKVFLKDLKWLGIDWDEGPEFEGCGGGDRGPYRQSERLDIYNRYFDQLIAEGKAYRAFETPEELEAARVQAREVKVDYRYDRAALKLDQATIDQYVAEGRPHVVRLKTPDVDEIVIHDQLLGDVIVGGEEIDDFVIRKADGYPTYHFAVVVDDALMGITHVLRGQEHLKNTARHMLIQDALGFRRPQYLHMSLTMNVDGSKMSKRDKAKVVRPAWEEHWKGLDEDQKDAAISGVQGLERPPERMFHPRSRRHRHLFQDVDHLFTREEIEQFLAKQTDDPAIAQLIADSLELNLPEIDLQDFRAAGYLPEVMVNFFALLGWSPGGDVEKFDADFLVENFSFERMIKSPSKFDRDKLMAFNLDALQAMPAEEFHRRLREHAERYYRDYVESLGENRFRMFAECNQARSKTLEDPFLSCYFFVMDDEDIAYESTKAVRKALVKGEVSGFTHLENVKPVLAEVGDWSVSSLEQAVEQYAQEQAGGNLGKVAQPLRIAVTGGTVSPGIFETLAILGRDAVLNRIERCLTMREAISTA